MKIAPFPTLLHSRALRLSSIPAFALLALLNLLPFLLYAQNNTVTGRVTDPDGGPVAAASVRIKGTTTGTSTNSNGEFTIAAAKGAVLVISSIGFTDKEVPVADEKKINIQLTRAAEDIGEVVVVGYGTQRKKDVTGAVVSVNSTALREVPVANLAQALQGRAAGLEVQRVGNKPGAGAQIRIRGNRSISGSNEPLLVVDGIQFEGTLNDINPSDIESVDVLKDASATAIYGSRGANGVMMVTTKKGRSGETRVSYAGYYGIGKQTNNYPVFNSTEYQAMRNLSTWSQGYMPEETKGMAMGRNTNWQDLMWENAQRQDHNLTVTGGNNNNVFSIGAGYFNETTMMPGEEFKRYSLRASVDSRIGRRIKIGLQTLNSLSIEQGSQFVSGSALFRMIANSPLMPAYDSAGNVVLIPNGNIDDNNTDGRYSPLLLKKNNDDWVDRIRRIRTFNTLYGEYEFFKGLRYRVNLGLNFAQQHNAQFQSADQPGNPSFFRAARGNTASVENGETWGYTLEHLLFYDKVIKEKHRIGFTGLYSIQESQNFNNYVRKDSITDDFVKWYNLALSTPVNSSNTGLGGGETKWSLISYMARLNYAFADKYLLTATFRRDGSSRLAKGNKWFDYPAINAGWVISEEDFMRGIGPISFLKLRAGWGKTSNQAINPYQSLGLVNNSNGLDAGSTGGNIIRYNFGPTVVSGYNVVTLPNPNLRWEFTRTVNLGLDFALLDQRITGAVEWYHSKTDNILYGVNLPVTSGVAGSFATNIGEMENKGMEFTLSTVNLRTASGFTWSTDLNLFFNKNKILKLSNNVTQDIGSQLFVGHAMSAIYDYNKLGIWQTHEAEEAARYGAIPGQIKLEDRAGPEGKPDGIISNTYDRYVIGDGDADLQGGITNRFSYKGFDLSAVIYARFGGMLISHIHQPNAAYLTVMDGKRNGLKVDYWTPTNPSNWFPMPQAAISPQSDAWSTLGYYKGSFVKLRSINLGYTFKKSTLQAIGAQTVRLYFAVDNVGILYSPYFKQTGIDPEGTGTGYQGVANGPGNVRNNNNGNGTITIGVSTPPRRTFTFGANITL